MRRLFSRCILLLSILMVYLCSDYAGAEIKSEMHATDWTWEDSKSAVFEGSVLLDGYEQEKVILKLFLEAFPEATDNGKVVFQAVNGKKLTLRKESDTYVFTVGSQPEFRFTGNWRTPESVFFDKITVTLRVYQEDESTVLSEYKLEVNRENDDNYDPEDGRIRITADIPKITRILLIAASIVWGLAIIRTILNRKGTR